MIWKMTEYFIGTADGIYKCRTIKPKVSERAYDAECLNYIEVTYSDYVLSGTRSKGARARFAEPEDPAVHVPLPTRVGNEFVPRRIYLKPVDFQNHGYTEGCPGCTWLQNGLGARRPHSDLCRDRMEDCFANSKNDRHRVDIQKSKMDTFIAAMEGERHEGPGKSREGANDEKNEPNESVQG